MSIPSTESLVYDVSFQSTDDPLQSLNESVLNEMLQELCKEAAEEFKREIVRQLDRRFSDFHVSERLKKQVPLLRDVLTFYNTLTSALRVVEQEDGFAVTVDTTLLRSIGLPDDFLEQLEYGSPDVATVSAWRPAIEVMARDIADRLEKEAIQRV